MEIRQMSTKAIADLWQELGRQERLALLEQMAADERKSVQRLAQSAIRQMIKAEKEAARLQALWQYERVAWQNGAQRVCGTDEVGRGPLAGPVVAAAVILPREVKLLGIDDSKKLSPAKREVLYEQIISCAEAYCISAVDNVQIDELNILEASRLAMARAVAGLAPQADFVLLDGWDNPHITLPHQAIIKGDTKSISIAAASIVAKVYRDRLMEAYEAKYPGYGFAQHKGYPTHEHYQALRRLGPTDIHRQSFNLKLTD